MPEPVYQRFEEIIGSNIPTVDATGKGVITVFTYDLGDPVPHGQVRELVRSRTVRFKLDEFSARFISGPNLPAGNELDNKIREILNIK